MPERRRSSGDSIPWSQALRMRCLRGSLRQLRIRSGRVRPPRPIRGALVCRGTGKGDPPDAASDSRWARRRPHSPIRSAEAHLAEPQRTEPQFDESGSRSFRLHRGSATTAADWGGGHFLRISSSRSSIACATSSRLREIQESAGALDGVDRAEDAGKDIRIVGAQFEFGDVAPQTKQVFIALEEELVNDF